MAMIESRFIRIKRELQPVTLSELPMHACAVVESVLDAHASDAIARRLRELGFVKGEPVRVVARGPVGGEPLLVQIGFTRFALRRSEAARVTIEPGALGGRA